MGYDPSRVCAGLLLSVTRGTGGHAAGWVQSLFSRDPQPDFGTATCSSRGKEHGRGALSVSPLFLGDKPIRMHGTGHTGLSQAAGFWCQEESTKARLKDLVS